MTAPMIGAGGQEIFPQPGDKPPTVFASHGELSIELPPGAWLLSTPPQTILDAWKSKSGKPMDEKVDQ